MNIRIILDVYDIPGSVSINRIAAIDRVALTGHGRAAFDRHDVVIGISFPCLTAENTIDRAPAHGDLIGQNITGTVANSIDPDSDPAFYSAFDSATPPLTMSDGPKRPSSSSRIVSVFHSAFPQRDQPPADAFNTFAGPERVSAF